MNKKEITDPTEGMRNELYKLVMEIMGSFRFLFYMLSLGVIMKYAVGMQFAGQLVEVSILIFTVLLVFINWLVKRKHEKSKKEGK